MEDGGVPEGLGLGDVPRVVDEVHEVRVGDGRGVDIEPRDRHRVDRTLAVSPLAVAARITHRERL